jgi:hypothetical protein
MSSTSPSQPQPQSQSQDHLRQAQYNTLITYTSLGALLLCPLLIALPPRKFDFYTVLLISGTAVGGNRVLREYTGRGITDRVPTLRRLVSDGNADSRLHNERIGAIDERLGRRDFGTGIGGGASAEKGPTTAAVARAVQEMKAADRAHGEAPAEVGEEEAPRRRKADWKLQRDAREKEALEDGRGYGGLIVDQIWEVWNWGRGTSGEEDGDEKEMEGRGEEGKK